MKVILATLILLISLNASAISMQCLQEAEFDIQNYFRSIGQELDAAYPVITLKPNQEYRGKVFNYTNNFNFNLHIFSVTASTDLDSFNGLIVIDEPSCEIADIIGL